MSLREKVVKGVAWSAVQQWGVQGITFFIFLILARLLEPEDFGLVALASVFTGFVQIVLDQGLEGALVQRANLNDNVLDTAFWANTLTGLLLTIGTVIFANTIAHLFSEPKLAAIITWLSFSFLLNALSSVQQAILRRRLDFKSLAIRSLVAIGCGGGVGIIAALMGYGVWSLVAQSLVKNLVAVLVLWRVSNWRPGLTFSKANFIELFSFGVSILGSKILSYLDTRLDDLLIGYFLGTTALGYYTVAYRLLRTALQLLSGTISAVALPTFSRLQKDIERLRNAFYQATQFSSLLAFPGFIGMAILAPELIIVLFGAKWTPSIPIMQILALVGIVLSVVQFNGWLIVALGKPDLLLKSKLLITIVRVCSFLIVVKMGIIAVAIAFAVTTYGVYVPLYTWMVNYSIDLDMKLYFRLFATPLIASLIMAVSIYGLKSVFADQLVLYMQLTVYVVIGFVVFLLVVYVMKPSLLHYILDSIRKAFSVRKLNSTQH